MTRADTPFFSNLGKAEWPTAYVNRLPDAAFLFIEPGGTKDSSSRTSPRSLRHLPVYDADGLLDLPHLRNAIASVPKAGKWASTKLKRELQDKARALLDAAQKSVTGGTDVPDWALAYLAHLDALSSVGAPLEKAHATWTGDKALGARALSYVKAHRVAPAPALAAVPKAVENTLRAKVAGHNADRTTCKATLGMLKAVWLRASAAHDTAGRPLVKSRDQWAMGRVHTFL